MAPRHVLDTCRSPLQPLQEHRWRRGRITNRRWRPIGCQLWSGAAMAKPKPPDRDEDPRVAAVVVLAQLLGWGFADKNEG